MATSGMSVDPKQASTRVPIVGVPLTQEEVEGTPQTFRFYYRAVKPSIIQRVVDALIFKSVSSPKQPYRCPRCTEADPDVTIPVINACARGPAARVSVECINGHWASYPCP